MARKRKSQKGKCNVWKTDDQEGISSKNLQVEINCYVYPTDTVNSKKGLELTDCDADWSKCAKRKRKMSQKRNHDALISGKTQKEHPRCINLVSNCLLERDSLQLLDNANLMATLETTKYDAEASSSKGMNQEEEQNKRPFALRTNDTSNAMSDVGGRPSLPETDSFGQVHVSSSFAAPKRLSSVPNSVDIGSVKEWHEHAGIVNVSPGENSLRTCDRRKVVKTYRRKRRLVSPRVKSSKTVEGGAGFSGHVLQNRAETALNCLDKSNASFCLDNILERETLVALGTSLNATDDILLGKDLGCSVDSEHAISVSDDIIVSNNVNKTIYAEDVSLVDADGENSELLNWANLNGIQTTVSDVVFAEKKFDESTRLSKVQDSSDAFGKDLQSECQNETGELKMEDKCPSLSQLDAVNDAGAQVMGKIDYPPQMLQPPLERGLTGCFRKKLLVLDVNGLLADIVPYMPDGYKVNTLVARKEVCKRPFCNDFLQFCFERFKVGVWSSRTKRNVQWVIDCLMGNARHNLLFCWDRSHCTDTGFNTVENRKKPLVLKELKKLWERHEPDLPWEMGEFNESNTLLLDDSPYKALCNPPNTAIFPHTYRHRDEKKDNSLGPGGDLRVYLEGLALAENVQMYVKQNPFGQRPITEKNLSWPFYLKVIGATSSQMESNASTSPVCQQ